MKALFIGGTGVISTAVGALALARGWELTLLNRGTNAARAPRGARVLTADIHEEAAVKATLGDERFDVAVDLIAFTEEDVQRDVRLFAGPRCPSPKAPPWQTLTGSIPAIRSPAKIS